MPAQIKIPTIFTGVDKFSHVVSKMSKNIRSFGKEGVSAVQRFDNKLTSSFNKMSRMGQLALGLSIGTVFGLAAQNNIAYEDSLASVSAITGAVGDDLVELEKLSKKTSKAQKMLGKDTLKAYELIGSAKPELLTNAKLLDDVTNSAVTLSKAGRMELAPAAEALTTTLNQFGLGGEHAKSVIDNLAAGAKYGSSSITNTSEALSKFGTIAAATGTKVNESIALIELVSPFEKGAEAGTKLRNILGKMAGAEILPEKALQKLRAAGVDIDIISDATLPLNTRLKEMSKLGKDTSGVMQVFGTENSALAQALFDNVDAFDDMLSKIDESGVALTQAETNTNTFRHAIDSIKTSFLNATTATQSNNKVLDFLKQILVSVSDNMEVVLAVVGSLIAAYVLMKAIIIANRIAMFAYNVVMGIQVMLNQNNKRALVGNTVAQGAYRIAMIAGTVAAGAMTAAQWLLNIALNANPIGLIVLGIAALIAVVAVIISKYDEWGASLALLLGPFGFIINLIQSFRRNWDMVKQAFKDGGIVGGLKAIGKVILDAVLMPVQQLLELLSNVPGIGDLAKDGAKKIEALRMSLGVDTGEAKDEAENSSAQVLPSISQASSESVRKSISESNLRINIKDKGNNVESVESDGNPIPINIGNTVGAF